jgi:hypothetical protein
MDVPAESLEDRLQYDFDAARRNLGCARREQQAKDTPAARRRVAERQAEVDRILDMWNDVLLTTA